MSSSSNFPGPNVRVRKSCDSLKSVKKSLLRTPSLTLQVYFNWRTTQIFLRDTDGSARVSGELPTTPVC